MTKLSTVRRYHDPQRYDCCFHNDYPFPNYGSLELPEQLSDRVISLLNSCLGFFTLLFLALVRK